MPGEQRSHGAADRPGPPLAAFPLSGADAGEGEVPLFRIRNLSKTFGETTVLHSVDLDILPGTIHGLVGENGSGKSTLIKILAGFHDPDPGGRVQIRGTDVAMPISPATAKRLGLSFVHQDLALVPSLSVAENMTINSLIAARTWKVTPKHERAAVGRLMDAYNLAVDPAAPVSSLTQLQKAMVAIVRAIEGMNENREHGQASLLVLDEPTVFLPRADRSRLFSLARMHTDQGGSVLFVSHDLEECLEVTDRISVLRDGRMQGNLVSATARRADIIQLMVGHELDDVSHRAPAGPAAAATAFESAGIGGTTAADVSFTIGAGEIVGITGLLGSGFEEVPYLAAGTHRAARGTVTVAGRHYDLARFRPFDAVEAGIALIPGDRARDGSVGSLSVLDNISLQSLRRYRRGIVLDWKAIRRVGNELVKEYDVRPPRLDAAYGTLSGGNQQKAMIAKWLHTQPRVLLLHEPTQGVDVGAREQIFAIVRKGAADGAAVLCASADQEQLALLCDRVLVMHNGRIAAELTGDQISKGAIARASLEANRAREQ
jgi:ribose transport system ATP-binding protein